MKYGLLFALIFSLTLQAETTCVTDSELEDLKLDMQEVYKTAEATNQLRVLRLYDNAIIKLDNTLSIRDLLVENSDLSSIKELDDYLVKQAQFIFNNLSEMGEDSLKKRAIKVLKNVSNSNERLQYSVEYDIDVNEID